VECFLATLGGSGDPVESLYDLVFAALLKAFGRGPKVYRDLLAARLCLVHGILNSFSGAVAYLRRTLLEFEASLLAGLRCEQQGRPGADQAAEQESGKGRFGAAALIRALNLLFSFIMCLHSLLLLSVQEVEN